MAEAVSSSSSRSETPPPTERNIAQEGHNKMSDMEPTAEDLSRQQTKMAELEHDGTRDTAACSSSSTGATAFEGALDKLLEKQRNELMYELRRIQHGDRPVTGQGNKEAVEQFFTRALNSDTDDRTEDPERNRPDNVIVEVNALVERRPVSSLLHSTGFRRSLENALRGAIGGGSLRRTTRAPQRSDSPAIPVPVAPSVPASGEAQVNEVVRQRHTVATSEQHVQSTQGRSIPQPQEQQGRVQNVQVSRSVDSSNPELPNESQSSGSPAQAWLQQLQQQQQSHTGQENVWDQIEEVHREELIMEISELVQRQLVTDTLHGNFRNVLERRMNERLQNVGADGRRIQQFVQSIPQSSVHVRNDFSNLGINVVDPVENLSDHLDEMSVISATAAVSVPYAQSNLAMTREIHSLKNQMKEMMNMMKLNFDLTMDVQRSVRQEMAAAMNASTGTDTVPTPASQPASDTECLICLDKEVDTVLYQCGHMCVCYTCGMSLRQRGSKCPVCRAPIKDIIRAYRCNNTREEQ